MAREESQASEVPVRHTRDALICLDLLPDRTIIAELRGVVVAVRNHGGVVFLDFEDATGSIQLMGQRNDLADDTWATLCGVRPADRIIASGKVGRSRRGQPTVYLTAPLMFLQNILEHDAPPTSLRELDRFSTGRVGVRLFLARLRYKAESFYRTRGFLQIEPNFISTSWEDPGIEPLRVHYEGFGVATYLTPSPAPQIHAAMTATGHERVFAVGRCFTTTYRDETTSAESLILTSSVARTTLDDTSRLLVEALGATLGDQETMPDNYGQLMTHGWRQSEISWPPRPSDLTVDSPTIQLFQLPSDSTAGRATSVVRACWPGRHVLGEGAVRRLTADVGLSTVTLHLERMVPLLRDVPLRQILDLQASGT